MCALTQPVGKISLVYVLHMHVAHNPVNPVVVPPTACKSPGLDRHPHLPGVRKLGRIVHYLKKHLARAGYVPAHPAGQLVTQVNHQFHTFFLAREMFNSALRSATCACRASLASRIAWA